MGTTITVESTIDYRYLMNKTKHDLAYMYMELLGAYNKELARNTPRPSYGIKIMVDPSIPKDTLFLVDEKGNTLGKFYL